MTFCRIFVWLPLSPNTFVACHERCNREGVMRRVPEEWEAVQGWCSGHSRRIQPSGHRCLSRGRSGLCLVTFALTSLRRKGMCVRIKTCLGQCLKRSQRKSKSNERILISLGMYLADGIVLDYAVLRHRCQHNKQISSSACQGAKWSYSSSLANGHNQVSYLLPTCVRLIAFEKQLLPMLLSWICNLFYVIFTEFMCASASFLIYACIPLNCEYASMMIVPVYCGV